MVESAKFQEMHRMASPTFDFSTVFWRVTKF